MNPALIMVCPVCSMSVKSHDGAARFGDRLMHGACYVKVRQAETIAACRPQDQLRDEQGLGPRLVESLRVAFTAEVRELSRAWTPALAVVSNTVTRTLVGACAVGKLEAVRVIASRVNQS